MSHFSAIIADDEAPLRSHLHNMLCNLWPELEISGLANNGEEAIKLIQENKPDIAFLDIKMPVCDGLQVAMKAGNLCHIVFVTAYDNYAIDAFENEVVDYILKPIDEGRLQKTIGRLKCHLSEKRLTKHEWKILIEKIDKARTNQDSDSYLRWIKASRQEDTLLISVDDIYYFMASDKYTSVISKDQDYLIRKTIRELESELDPNLFWRIHRSTLVNTTYIDVARKMFNGRYILHLKNIKDTLTVSRSYASKFKQM